MFSKYKYKVMPINLIASIVYHKNRFLIGKENELIIKIKDDLRYFKQITSNKIYETPNVILMGRKTWFSIPIDKRPLSGRVNFVFTNDLSLIELSKKKIKDILNGEKLVETCVYFINMKIFEQIYERFKLNVFVIGGGEIYDMFLESTTLTPETLYITEVKDYFKYNVYDDTNYANKATYKSIKHISDKYKLISVSSKNYYEKDDRITYRFLKYKLIQNGGGEHGEHMYINMLKDIINNGNKRIDRTNTGTVSVFGRQMRFDISNSLPLLTTRNIPIKVIIEELLWFLRGDTNANILKKNGVNIWNKNTSREFLDNRGLCHYDSGVLGPGYGFQMRFFGAEYSQIFSDTSLCDRDKIGGFDQLMYVLNTLKTDPYSRRIMMSYWNPPDFEKTALLPCHCTVQFYVENNPIKGSKPLLSCQFYMRSNDFALANNFNVISYSILTYILALKCDMLPKEIIYTCGDTHIYNDHIEPIKLQLERDPRPFPYLILNDSIKNKDFNDIKYEDFELCGYYPYPNIKLAMAV